MLGPSFPLVAALILRLAFGDASLKDTKSTTCNAIDDDPSGLLIELENPEDYRNFEDDFASGSAKQIKTLTGTLMEKSSDKYDSISKLYKRENKRVFPREYKGAIIPRLVEPSIAMRPRVLRETPVILYKDVPFEATYDGNSKTPTIITLPPMSQNNHIPVVGPDIKVPHAQIIQNLKKADSPEPEDTEKPVSMTFVIENVFPKSTNYIVHNTSEISDDGKLVMNFQLIKQPSNQEFKTLLVNQKDAHNTQEWKQSPLNYNILQAHKDKARLEKMHKGEVEGLSLQPIHASAAHTNYNPQIGISTSNLGGPVPDKYGLQGGKVKSNNFRFFPISLKSPSTKSPAGILHELGAVLKSEGDIEKMDKNRLRNLLVKSALSLINQDVLEEAKLLKLN